ncbi:hypothetical protein B0H15DRAFT_823810 [Mycena belliarum]|uniref:MARVEL domain-containing protein n=1 Tax=Mycena belliarum TaxID=1033014 RepID=A0AAD6XV47_9AGAR|nr:hypothetical protein B0H15DRAFT_823810 [Mycena belliae]
MNFLATLRYLVFAVFIVCNAILASVAVWNSSLVSPASRDFRIDTYLIVVGALGLALTFAIIFAELVHRNSFTSHVWFDILWTCLFFGLDLAGATILTDVGPRDLCKQQKTLLGSNPSPGSCSSTRVLLVFTWLCTIILFIYLVLLISLTVSHRKNESVPRIWECTIHNFPPLTSPTPDTRALPRFTNNKMAEVVSPVPRRPTTVPSALYTLRSVGLGSQYEIEHFRPPAHLPAPRLSTLSASSPRPVTSSAIRPLRSPSTAGNAHAAVTLYPQFLSSAPIPPPSPIWAQQPHATSTSPPPLGDWPRTDAPLRIKRKPPPAVGLQSEGTLSRPLGPRTRVRAPNPRPPPRDLSSLSSTRQGRERQT